MASGVLGDAGSSRGAGVTAERFLLPTAMRCLLAVVLLLSGCGTRTALSVARDPVAPDSGPADAGPGDSGPHDAGTLDAGRSDAGRGGAPCTSDRTCGAPQVCRGSADDTPRDLEAVRLFCGGGEPDPSGGPGSPCAARTTCDRHLCAVAGTCVVPCADNTDCAPDERCRETWVQTSPRAMEHLTACGARFALPDTVRLAGPEPGPVAGPARAADDLPRLDPNALVVWSGPTDGFLLIEEILTRGARPEAIFDAFASRGRDAPAPAWGVRATTVAEVATLLWPNGPNSPRPDDGFEIWLNAAPSSPTDRVVIQRERPATEFDIDIYLVGGGGWTSTGILPSPLVPTLDEVRAVFASLGLRIGDVRTHQVVGGLRARLEVLEGSVAPLNIPEELPELYRLSTGSNRPSIHIFLVRMIEGALGIASGIPGPHGMPGTGASGVAIAVDVIPPDELAGVIVHEVGHFMGLFHTSEADGSVSEPLTDTAECRSSRDADRDGYVSPMECEGFGADNIMFWAGGERFSAQQIEVMRRAYFAR